MIPYSYNLPTIFKIRTFFCVAMETVFDIIKNYCPKLYKEMYMSIYIDICIYIDMHIYMCVGIFIKNCNCILCIFKKENEVNLDYNFCVMYAIIYAV